MIERKVCKGDMLWLNESNAFLGTDVVTMIPGYFTVTEDSEPGDPLVHVLGSYVVKRAALCELNPDEVRVARAAATIRYAGLQGSTAEEVREAYKQLAIPAPERQA